MLGSCQVQSPESPLHRLFELRPEEPVFTSSFTLGALRCILEKQATSALLTFPC